VWSNQVHGIHFAATGVLALMLSVKERMDEIGMRVAVGARPRGILVSFLETTVLALGGWVGRIAPTALR